MFHEARFRPQNEDDKIDSSKIYKVSYSLNMLPWVEKYCVRGPKDELEYVNEDISLMNACYNSDELNIFDSQNFKDLIQFKWDTFARKLHMRGCIAHFFYLAVMTLYVEQVYIQHDVTH